MEPVSFEKHTPCFRYNTFFYLISSVFVNTTEKRFSKKITQNNLLLINWDMNSYFLCEYDLLHITCKSQFEPVLT